MLATFKRERAIVREEAKRFGERLDSAVTEAEPSADTARLLDHLYDAVDCEALPPGFAQRLQEHLDAPVYEGLAQADHPIYRLLPALSAHGSTSDATDRRALLEHVMRNDPDALTGWLAEYAQRALPAQLPGVTIRIERRAA